MGGQHQTPGVQQAGTGTLLLLPENLFILIRAEQCKPDRKIFIKSRMKKSDRAQMNRARCKGYTASGEWREAKQQCPSDRSTGSHCKDTSNYCSSAISHKPLLWPYNGAEGLNLPRALRDNKGNLMIPSDYLCTRCENIQSIMSRENS